MGAVRLPGRLEEEEQEPQGASGRGRISSSSTVHCSQSRGSPQAPQEKIGVNSGASSTDSGEQLRDTENPSAVGHHCWSGLLGNGGGGAQAPGQAGTFRDAGVPLMGIGLCQDSRHPGGKSSPTAGCKAGLAPPHESEFLPVAGRSQKPDVPKMASQSHHRPAQLVLAPPSPGSS